ncbi:MAG: sigma-70 family RNA polymerase sigma factor [Deltaproteobacteria bacterium]|nr:sigma-70 family RNA polymerase sigma factor [Deltaproteobacteria bacterium]
MTASRKGERAAFGALIERYQGVVCAVSYSRTGDRTLSEDVAQETFIAAWRQLDRLRETVKLRSWLCGIARNLARKARRKSDRELPLPLEGELIATGDSPFDAVSDAQSERVVREALSRVPETYREPLILFYCEGLTSREIADALDISEAAAQQRLSRGRQYLAEGVTDLVERALRGQRNRRSLVAAVLAALPVIPSPADASTSSHGGHMFKLALVAAGLAVTGTTAYLVDQHRSASTPEASLTTPAVPVTTPKVAEVSPRAPGAIPPIVPRKQPQLAVQSSDEPPEQPTVDRATLQRLGLDRGPSRGPRDAPVTIVMFTDAMCKYCSNVLGTIDQVWDEFPGKLRLVVKQFPVHKEAVLAAEASLAAAAQDRYWEFHEQMFANPDDLGRDALVEDARRAGLDVAAFRTALDNHTFAAALAAEQAAAKEIDISATPSFLINGKHFIGARPVEAMREEITAALGQ